jgi:hypothetical protein
MSTALKCSVKPLKWTQAFRVSFKKETEIDMLNGKISKKMVTAIK